MGYDQDFSLNEHACDVCQLLFLPSRFLFPWEPNRSVLKPRKCFMNLLKAGKYGIVRYVGSPAGIPQDWRSSVLTAKHFWLYELKKRVCKSWFEQCSPWLFLCLNPISLWTTECSEALCPQRDEAYLELLL